MNQYIDRHQGQRAFVIGNGPSLKDTNLQRLEGEVTFGSNRIYLYPFTPAYYAVTDWLVAVDCRHDIQTLAGAVKFLPKRLKQYFPNWDGAEWIDLDQAWIEGRGAIRFWESGRVFGGGGTVTYLLLQLAFMMGCDPVYLVGVDHDYTIPAGTLHLGGGIMQSTGADPNHFDPTYFGAGRRFHDPKTERMENAYIRAKQAYEAAGRRVYNATLGGKLEVFERVDYDAIA